MKPQKNMNEAYRNIPSVNDLVESENLMAERICTFDCTSRNFVDVQQMCSVTSTSRAEEKEALGRYLPSMWIQHFASHKV